MSREFNVLALVKGDEHYVYVYDDESGQALLDAIQEHAAEAELSLNGFDAAVLTQKAHEQAQRNEERSEAPSRLPS